MGGYLIGHQSRDTEAHQRRLDGGCIVVHAQARLNLDDDLLLAATQVPFEPGETGLAEMIVCLARSPGWLSSGCPAR
jgi:hypothetical protein